MANPQSATRNLKLIRPLVRDLHAYVPGEQPKIKGLIKLNTNENPYPPSPRVLAAVRAAADGRLRLYPNPTAQVLREKLAKLHGCKPENIIIGNGSKSTTFAGGEQVSFSFADAANSALVAVTGWGQEADRARAKEAGFTHHFVKPISEEALRSILAEVSAAQKH